MNENRLDMVKSLIEFSLPLDALASCIREFEWDYEGTQVELSRVHLINVLNRYLNKELSANDVESWANLLEGREDVYFEHGSEAVLDEIMYQIANPDLTDQLSEDRANIFVAELSK